MFIYISKEKYTNLSEVEFELGGGKIGCGLTMVKLVTHWLRLVYIRLSRIYVSLRRSRVEKMLETVHNRAYDSVLV